MSDTTNPAEIYKVYVEVRVGPEQIGSAFFYIRALNEEQAATFARMETESCALWDERIHDKHMDVVDVSEISDGVHGVPEGEAIRGLPDPDEPNADLLTL
jgi:hypothetical protein